jgi:hypothetical protein
MLIYIVGLSLLVVTATMQKASARESQFDVLVGYHYFSGLAQQSIAPNTGYVLRFAAGTRKGILRWTSNLSLLYATATNEFDDGGTTRDLAYTLMGGEFNIGFKVAPLGNFTKLPIQPYFGATGAVQIDSFVFGEDATTSATFPKTDATQFFGYNVNVGVDLSMSKRWGFVVAVEQSKVSGTLAATPFVLDGNRVFIGLYFK